MAEIANPTEVYQLHFPLRGINPPVWRRILIPSHGTIADLHYILQIALNWTDFHFHRFVLRGREYGLGWTGGIAFRTDARQLLDVLGQPVPCADDG